MPKLKIKYNKQAHELEAINLVDFKQKVYLLIQVTPENLKIIKPPIKDEKAFAALKQNTEIVLMGTQEKKIIKVDPIEQQLAKLPQNQRQTYFNRKNGIFQNGTLRQEDIGEVTYITSSVQLIRVIKQFRDHFLMKQQLHKNSNRLMVKDLVFNFGCMQDANRKEPACSLDLVSSFVAFAEEVGSYPYQTHDCVWFFHYLFEMLKEGAKFKLKELQSKQWNWISHHFMIKYNTINDDYEGLEDEPLQKNFHMLREKWWMTAAINDKSITNVKKAITTGYQKKKTEQVRELYGLDVKHYQQILDIHHLPPFVLVNIDRMFALQQKRDLDNTLFEHLGRDMEKRYTHYVHYPKTIDFFDECQPEVKAKLKAGRQKRDLFFKQLLANKSKQFQAFKKTYKYINQAAEYQLLYAFYQSLMKDEQYYQFYYKQYKYEREYQGRTGQYNLFGVVTHQGEKIDSDSTCVAYIERPGRKWYRFHNQSVKIVDINEVMKFTGNNDKDNRKDEFAHLLIYRCVQFE